MTDIRRNLDRTIALQAAATREPGNVRPFTEREPGYNINRLMGTFHCSTPDLEILREVRKRLLAFNDDTTWQVRKPITEACLTAHRRNGATYRLIMSGRI